MKKIVLFLLVLSCSYVYGQSMIADWTPPYNGTTVKTIVRSCGEDVCVVYTESSLGEYYFNVVNTQTHMVWSFPVDEEVNDVEVLDDTVYYCGYVGYPALCSFSLAEVYTGSVNRKYLWFPREGATINPKRFELFRATGGIHAVMVGDWILNNEIKSFIADVWHPYALTGGWHTTFHVTIGKECYDDIAVTDNYVVASAHADGTNNIMLRVLNKPLLATYASSSPVPVIISNNNIFYSCSLGSSGCDIYGYVGYNYKKAGSHGEYPIFLTRTQGDHVVLSCMAASTTGEYGITVKDIGVTSGVPNVYKELCSWWGTSFVPGWNLRDVRYNNNNDTILVLVDRESPLDGQVSSGVGKVDNAMFMSCIFTFPLSPMILHSVDKFFSRGVGSLPWYFLSHWMICSGSFDIPLCTTPALWSNNKMDDVCSRHLFKEIDMNTGKMTLFSLPQIEPKLIYCYQEHIQNTIVTIGELQSKCEGD